MRLRWLSGVLFVGAAVACSEGAEVDDSTSPINPIGGTIAGGTAGVGATLGGGASTPGATTGGSTTTPGGITGGVTPTPGATQGGGAAGGGAGNNLPCEVSAILKEKCQTCHGDPLMSGPMKLITLADLQAASTAKPGQTVAQRVKARMLDTIAPMPPLGRTALTAAEKTTLSNWIDGGAKGSSATCGTTTTPAPGGVGGTTGGGGTTGAGLDDYIPPDSECEFIQELRAHGGQTPGDTSPYMAPTGGDHYEIFYFKPKWTTKVHTIRLDPIIDNGAILHHWLLYMEPNGSGDGTHKSDLGLQPADSQLLSGWAPGNKSIPLGRNIGLQTITGPNSRFAIELHYNTSSNPASRADRSGARVCATSKLRAHEASVHWLGTQGIIGLGLGGMFDAFGTCTVKQESHVIAHSPHMHKLGRYQKTIVAPKGGGAKIKITDQPFAFDDQQIYPVDSPTGEIVVKPGDVITTTCTYDGSRAVTFGPNTDQEMCYNFVVAWPAGSLSNGAAGIVGGKNTCID